MLALSRKCLASLIQVLHSFAIWWIQFNFYIGWFILQYPPAIFYIWGVLAPEKHNSSISIGFMSRLTLFARIEYQSIFICSPAASLPTNIYLKALSIHSLHVGSPCFFEKMPQNLYPCKFYRIWNGPIQAQFLKLKSTLHTHFLFYGQYVAPYFMLISRLFLWSSNFQELLQYRFQI